MFRCPTCNKTKKTPMDLARHMVMPTAKEEIDSKHKTWIDEHNVDCSKGFSPLAILLEQVAKIAEK